MTEEVLERAEVTVEEACFIIRPIPAMLIDRLWLNAEPFIKRALDHANGEFLPADIKQFCKDRVVQLWLVTESNKVIGACTTEIVNYPRRRHCRVITLAGSRAAEWTGQLDTILADWARQQGCSAIEAYVRKGYVPVLAKHGYKHKYSAIIKEIG